MNCVANGFTECRAGEFVKVYCPENTQCVMTEYCNSSCQMVPRQCQVDVNQDQKFCIADSVGMKITYPKSNGWTVRLNEPCKFCMGPNLVTRKVYNCMAGKSTDVCPKGQVCFEDDTCKARCEPIIDGCPLLLENTTEIKPLGCNLCDESGYKILSCMKSDMANKFQETLTCPIGSRCTKFDECETICKIVDSHPCVDKKKNARKITDYKFDGCYFCSENGTSSISLCQGKDGIKTIPCSSNEICAEPQECQATCQFVAPVMASKFDLSKIWMPLAIILLMLLIIFVILFIRQKLRYKTLKRRFTNYRLENQANMNPLVLIKSDELQISAKKLGGGEFGNVYSGIYRTNEKKYPVAVKVLKGVEEQELIKEAGIMAQLDHPHLSKLIGISLADGIKIVTPLRPLGSLEIFLKSHRDRLLPQELILYCYQIASAMAYLVSKNILHRDLATRNVLMRKRDHVEVTDFGLSAVLQQNLALPSRMPYRWVAMEVLDHPRDKSLYTEASDVWSFGVTCWEVLTYAQIPYEHVNLDQPVMRSLFTHLQNGNRLKGGLELYQTLLLCWAPKPVTRPSFKTLKETLEEYKKDPMRYVTTQRTISVDQGFLKTIDDDNYFGQEVNAFYEKLDTDRDDLEYGKFEEVGLERQVSVPNVYAKAPDRKRSHSFSSDTPVHAVEDVKSIAYRPLKRPNSYLDVVEYSPTSFYDSHELKFK